MANRVVKVGYCYPMIPNRAGQGAAVLARLREEGVDLMALVGFPSGGGRAQLDLVPTDMARLRRAAKRMGIRLSKVKRAFLIQGDDRLGAVHAHLLRLAAARISVTAAAAVGAGRGRYGMILWVKPKDFTRASRALRAR